MDHHQRLRPGSTLGAETGFFAHHGMWAPAVRLFRNLRFPSKVGVILLMLLFPMTLLLVLEIRNAKDLLARTERQRQGVEALQAFTPLTSDLIHTRNSTRALIGGYDAAVAYKTSREAADQKFATFTHFLQRTGDSLGLREDFEKLQSAWVLTAESKGGLDASGKNTVFVPVTDAAVKLLQKIQDSSGLSLDRDLDTFYLGQVLAQTLPQLLEDSGQLRAWSTFWVARGDTISLSEHAETQRRFAVWDANVRRGINDAQGGLKRVAAFSPDLGRQIDLEPLDRLEAFRAQVYKVIFDGVSLDADSTWNTGNTVMSGLQSLVLQGLPALDARLSAREARVELTLIISLGLVGFGLLATAYFSFGFYLVIRGGFTEVERHLLAMTDGDLSTRPRPWGRDEAADLMHTLARMQDSLRDIVTLMRNSSAEIDTSAIQMAQAADELATRTSQAAAALEQTGSSMHGMQATSHKTAAHAMEANAMAGSNADAALQGGEMIEKAISTMQKLDEASRRIGEIVSTIDGIAFQTNILALNAAVEAARAGSHGRGFAVVATEVRELAQRSSAASRDVRQLISKSVEQAAAGSSVVRHAGEGMSQILHIGQNLRAVIDEMAKAAREQFEGISQIGTAVQELDRMTQQNAALVEQSSAAAQSLRERSSALFRQVERFRLPSTALSRSMVL